jgi:mannose-6-phosphate isomerase-like protein (cupin superfamily)
MKIERPWGNYEVLNEGEGFKVKVIEVSPKSRMSLQRHQQRSEHWVVVEGQATVTSGDKVFTRLENESAYIPMDTIHRLENKLDAPLKIIEVQCGSYTEEDDIERFEDDYDRK